MIDDIPSKEKVYRITDTDISMHSQDSFTRKLINPTYITKDDCQRSYAHSNLVKIIDKEPSTKSSVVNFEGSLNTTYVGGDKFELPFFDIKSDTFQKTEQDLLVYSKPLTDVIKRSSVRNIFRIEDKAFINEIDVILEDTLQKVSGSYTNEGDFTALFDIFKQQKLKAATLLMSSGTYSKLVGDSDNGPCRIMSSIIVTDRNNLIRDNLIYAFAPQECLGKFFIHDDIELHIEKTRNIISWSASVTLGIGISNINAIARLDLSWGIKMSKKDVDEKLTDKEWTELIKEWCKQYDGGKHQRPGQAYMNALFIIKPGLYSQLTETENDCFYDDNKIINFIRRLN